MVVGIAQLGAYVKASRLWARCVHEAACVREIRPAVRAQIHVPEQVALPRARQPGAGGVMIALDSRRIEDVLREHAQRIRERSVGSPDANHRRWDGYTWYKNTGITRYIQTIE